MYRRFYLCAVLLLSLAAITGQAQELEHVVLQLKWQHSYQFAGYHMAKEKGYYRDAGLDVEIREGGPENNFVEEVVSGRAQYATGANGILLDRSRGQPIVVLGVIFQHSPDVLFVSKASGITSPQQLIGKTVMDSISTPAIAPMLLDEAGSLDQFNLIPQNNDYAGLMEGKFDAIGGYVTDETYFYEVEHQFPVNVIKPINYGIDFYGDNLFTSEAEIAQHPERVEAFMEASFRGWRYAMEHPEETIPVILGYRDTRDAAHLKFEYEAMRGLILPKFVELGYMNPGRWERIAQSYVKLGLLQPEFSLQGFLYDPDPAVEMEQLRKFLLVSSMAALVALVITLLLSYFYRRLARRQKALSFIEVQQRLLISQSPAAIAMFDREMRYVVCSDRWRSDYNLGDQKLLGRSHYEIFPEISQRWREIHQRCLAGATEKCDEDRFERRDGSIQWLQWEVRPWRTIDNEIGGIVMLTSDRTEQHLAMDAVIRTGEQLRATVENTPNVAVQWYDQKGKVVFWNKASENIFGWSKAEAEGKTLDQLVHTPEEMAEFIATCAEIKHSGKPTQPTEYTFTRRDGTKGTCLSTIFEISGMQDQSLFARMDVDITLQKEADDNLRKIHLALTRAMPGISRLDPEGRYVDVNNEYARLLGYTPENLVGKDWAPTVHADDRDIAIAAYQRMVREGEGEFEARAIRADGSQCFKQVLMVKITDDKGNFAGHHCFMRDISDRKRAETAREILLILSHLQFNTLLEHFQAIVRSCARALEVERVSLWILNGNVLESRVQYLASTDSFQEGGSYTLAQDSPYCNLLMQRESIRVTDTHVDHLIQEFCGNFEYHNIRALLDVPIWKQGAMVGVLGCDRMGTQRVWTDAEEEFVNHLAAIASAALEAEERRVAERQIRELNETLERRVQERTAELENVNAELQQARNVAQSANAAKSDFLSRMSHELRTPLHAILGFTQVLEQGLGDAPAEQKEPIRQIQTGGQHLLELINEVLDLTRIDTGNLELFLEDIDLEEGLCAACLATLQPMAKRNQVELSLKAEQTRPVIVYADRMRLKQVLLNLLSNAIKYNRSGGKVLLGYRANAHGVTLTVTDTGMGIDADKQHLVFQPFTRMHKISAEVEGTGIGLTISYRLARAMGGDLRFESEAGVGSTFTLVLRAGRHVSRSAKSAREGGAVEEQTSAPAVFPTRAVRILYVEDTEANIKLMRHIVKRIPGVELLESVTAEAGIKLAREQRPDLILMDIDLPGMSGIEALQVLRGKEGTREIPVVAVTAAAMAHDLDRIHKAGFNDILNKPFNINIVPVFLARHLGKNSESIKGKEPKRTPQAK